MQPKPYTSILVRNHDCLFLTIFSWFLRKNLPNCVCNNVFLNSKKLFNPKLLL